MFLGPIKPLLKKTLSPDGTQVNLIFSSSNVASAHAFERSSAVLYGYLTVAGCGAIGSSGNLSDSFLNWVF